MAQEIEAKFRVDAHEPIRQELHGCSARGLGTIIERNRIYDRPDASLRKAGCGLRVRACFDLHGSLKSATMTFKGPVAPGAFKSREEIETSLTDPEAAAELFERLGFLPVLVFEKKRESWRLGSCRVELDEVPQLGLFVEIEGPTELDICQARDRIGLADVTHEKASYAGLLLNYCADHGITNPVFSIENA